MILQSLAAKTRLGVVKQNIFKVVRSQSYETLQGLLLVTLKSNLEHLLDLLPINVTDRSQNWPSSICLAVILVTAQVPLTSLGSIQPKLTM